MTVTISKRLFSSTEGGGQTLGSPPPASKRLRVLPPFSEHLPSTHNLKTGSTAAGPCPSQQTHSSTQRKRRHDTEPGNGAAAATSPAGSGKRVSSRHKLLGWDCSSRLTSAQYACRLASTTTVRSTPRLLCVPATTLQGKRDDGRPSNAAPSPNSAKTALEALLTCEGLERVSQPQECVW